MQRKLIRQGGGGYTIYLPKKWVDVRGLKPGQQVTIEEMDAELIIRASGQLARELELSIEGDPSQFIRMKLMNLYRLGYDRVRISYASEPELNAIKETLKELPGFVIMELKTGKSPMIAIVEGIAEPGAERYETLVRRILYIFGELLGIIGRNLDGSKESGAELVEEAYRHDHFCRRAISKRMVRGANDALLWTFHSQLIHALRETHFLNQYLIGKRPVDGKELRALWQATTRMLKCLQAAYSTRQGEALLPIYQDRGLFIEKKEELLRKADPVVVHHFLDILRNLYLTASPLFAMTFTRSASK
jgi:bifunctional DNA-binding transcriptional regulator/antitoxin component of YhaV-PrlF toxin-antitoxin module